MARVNALRGLVAQSMNGQKDRPRFSSGNGPTNLFPPGSYTFVIPTSGKWKFVGWGAGGGTFGSPGTPAGSGACFEITRFLAKGQQVSITVGACAMGGATGGTTTVVLSNGVTASATGGTASGTGGTATGGDVNLNGSAAGVAGLGTGGGASSAGGGAPANLPFRGGAGGAINVSGTTPGGASGDTGTNQNTKGGDGLVVAFLVPTA